MAMSLGQQGGVVLIGRPLDIAVQAVLDPQEDPVRLCLQADISYADNKIDSARIRATSQKKSQATNEAVIYIRTDVVVNEPIVTVNLRVGCLQKIERRYVVLTDLVSDTISQPGGTPFSPAVNSAPKFLPAQSLFNSPATVLTGIVKKSPKSGADTFGKRIVTPTNERRNSRLKLETVNSTIELIPRLKLSAELLGAPSLIPEERKAAAALWRALASPPETITRDIEKLQALELSVRDLQSQTQKSQKTIDELNGRIKKVSSERYLNIVVYSLSALLLFAFAALAYFWYRRSAGQNKDSGNTPWWHKNESFEKGWANKSIGSSNSSPDSELDVRKKNLKKNKKTPSPALDLDLNLNFRDSQVVKGQRLAVVDSVDSSLFESRRERPDFAVSMTNHPVRAVKAEDLFDVQQQADFFVSLGQHEQAIEVLRSHIGENTQTSALVYLDLFSLYYQLKRQTDYEALREDFNQRFNGKIPAFDLYNDSGPGLESYQVALSHIQELWPSRKVLDLIEESIFRKPDVNNTEAFDLEAYRELLLLYAVAKEIITHDVSENKEMLKFDLPTSESVNMTPKSSKLTEKFIRPLPVLPKGQIKHDSPSSKLLPPNSSSLGLDLDLSQFGNDDEIAKSPLTAVSQSENKFSDRFPFNSSDAFKISQDSGVNAASSTQPSQSDNLIDMDPFDHSIETKTKKHQ